jgi:dipeptidyl aminopeptidase/acylaminoacyl peptidase
MEGYPMRLKTGLICLSFFLSCFVISVSRSQVSAADDRRFAELDVFQLEYVSDPQISPDGTQIVYQRNSLNIMKDRSQSELWIVNVDGTEHRKLTSGEYGESSPRWSPDGNRVLYVAKGVEGAEIFVRWMHTGQTARLTQLAQTPRGITWSPDGNWIAFTMLVAETPPELVKPPSKPKNAQWAKPPLVITRLRHEADGSGYLEPGYHHIFVLPAQGGTPRQLTSGSFHHRDAPVWAWNGKSLIFSSNRTTDWEYEFVNSEIYSVTLEDGTIHALTDRYGPDKNPTVSPDGKKIAYLGFDDKIQTYQVTHLYVMNRDGSEKRRIIYSLDRSISQPVWDSSGEGIYFKYDDRGNTKIGYTTLNGTVNEVTGNLGGTALGRPYGGGSFSVSSGGLIAFTYTKPEHPADAAVWSRETGVELITELNRDVLGYRDLGKVEDIWYESSDDQRRIQGWIVTPPGFDPKRKYPLILEIHGGPISNYGDRFSAEIQLYAAAGYVVFYANPRGSTGYGEEFGNLLYHDYPGGDYEDLISGVDVVIARGYIDENNLFVTGGSAGGIMTAWIVGKTSRFKAAVVVKPVMNWYSKTLVADNYYSYHNYRYPGSPWENPEIYMKYSPISLVGNISTPTLVMVGTADLRTPLSEAKQLYHALKLRKIETALVTIPGAWHNISARPSQLITKTAHVLAWFKKYLERDR